MDDKERLGQLYKDAAEAWRRYNHELNRFVEIQQNIAVLEQAMNEEDVKPTIKKRKKA